MLSLSFSFFSFSLSLSLISDFQSRSWIAEGECSCVSVSHAHERLAFVFLCSMPSTIACANVEEGKGKGGWSVRTCVQRVALNENWRTIYKEREGERSLGKWGTQSANCGAREADLRWDVCVLSRLHTGAWNVRFLWSRRMAKVYKGAYGVLKFGALLCVHASGRLGWSLQLYISFFLSFSFSVACIDTPFKGPARSLRITGNAVEQRKPVRYQKRDARAPLQGRRRTGQSAELRMHKIELWKVWRERSQEMAPEEARSPIVEVCFRISNLAI